MDFAATGFCGIFAHAHVMPSGVVLKKTPMSAVMHHDLITFCLCPFMAAEQTTFMTQNADTAEQTAQLRSPTQSGASAATEDPTDLGCGGPTSAYDLQPPKPNRRTQARYLVRWRAAIIGEGIKYVGRTENVSLSGAAVLCDANMRPGQEVKLYLEVPLNQSTQTAVFEATGVVMHSTLTNQGFRLGVAFRSFQGDSQSLLRKALSSGSYRELVDPYYS